MNTTLLLEHLSPRIRGVVLDMDGVLWKDTRPIGDLAAIFSRMRVLGLKVMLATNNATMTVDQYLQRLNGFGVTLESKQIITSAHAAADALHKAYPAGGAVFVVGEKGVITALCEAGFSVVTDPENETAVVAVVAGLDRALSYDKLRRAMWHVRSGAGFYGTNPDPTFPTPGGLVPGAGSILAAIQTAAGSEPVIIGKPSSFMLSLCAERMQLDLKEILMVGDRLETDIAGAQKLGARAALVLSGVSTRQQAEQWVPQPDLIAPDLASLVGA